jgi:hypothetical protein
MRLVGQAVNLNDESKKLQGKGRRWKWTCDHENGPVKKISIQQYEEMKKKEKENVGLSER